MYKNLFTIQFILKEICRELKRKNVQFSTNGKIVSILPINIHISNGYVGIYQDYGKHELLFKEDKNLCELIIKIAESKTIKTETISQTTSIFRIQILITKHDIVCLQNGRIL